jgi:glycine betaine/proline transport system substrate-binding protein
MRTATLYTTLGAGLLLAASALHSTPAHAVDCGEKEKVTIAEMTWLSAGINAHVFEHILAEGYGCNVELVPGDTVPTATSMLTKTEPTIAPEAWIQSAPNIWEKIKKKGNIYLASEIFTEGGNEGWWIPDYVAEEHPDLETVKDLQNYADLFSETAAGGKGRVYGCPPGWGCEIKGINLYKALKLSEHGYENEIYSPGSGTNLKAVIARKVKREQPIATYYWGPTAVIGRYNLVKLETPWPYDEEKFQCFSSSKCEDPPLVDWPSTDVMVAVDARLKDSAPDVVAFLEKVQIPNETMNEVLAWTDKNSAEVPSGAEYFLENYQDLWTQWVPAEAAERIKASL